MATEIRGDEMFVEGVEHSFIIDPARGFWVDVDAPVLMTRHEFDVDEQTTRSTVDIRGIGQIRNDSLSIAGVDELKGDRLTVYLKAVHPSEKEWEWRSHIGFVENDWQFDREGEFYLTGYLPLEVFTSFQDAISSSHVRKLTMILNSKTLWISKENRRTSPAYPLTWYLPPKDQDKIGGGYALLTMTRKSNGVSVQRVELSVGTRAAMVEKEPLKSFHAEGAVWVTRPSVERQC